MKTSRLQMALVLALAFLAGACRLSYTGGAREATPQLVDASWHVAAPTPVVRQRQPMDCGLAALAMVAGTWGRTWTLAELQREAPPGKTGVRLGKLRDVARARGLRAYAIAGTPKDLERELAAHRPVVLGLVLPYEQKRATTHFEVVVAYDPRNGSIVTLDPATGKRMQRTAAVLEQEWKPAGYAALVVVGT